ncbi:MAG: ABC transporter substrate-binding protein [Clostridioides sp.]|jgi:NitT/TauT family transport system substrate-binding protein|nr:ABC transporter substrate-binding protein [Clostridioides sp.]
MLKKLISAGGALVLGLALLTGCSSDQSKETSAKKLDKVTLAEVTHSVFYAPQYVAMNKGFFEDEGIKIDIINTDGADKTMAALLSGEAQVGLMGPEASIYVHQSNKNNYSVVFAQLTKRDGSFLMSRNAYPNFTYNDMKGAEVLGGRKGGMPEMTFEYVLKQQGLKLGKDKAKGEVNVRTDVAYGVMAGAFAGGEADFTTVFEPTATTMEKDGQGYIVASIGKDSGEIPYTAYATTRSYLNGNKDLIQRFTNATYKGQLWVQKESAENIATEIQPYFNDISHDDLVSVVNRYKSIDAWSSDPVLKEESLNRLVSVMKEAGELEGSVSYKDIVNVDFAENAIKNIK